MCGIAGWIDFEKDLSEKDNIIDAMIETLKLRGPDSEGKYMSRHVLLGHRRLIVVDPEGGKQPMKKEIGGNEYIIVYNGELYNTEDLRQELLKEGYEFDSYSDTEVLLTSYICWGESCVERLNGIFAFAVYDKSRESVFLARDPLGVKPLFFSRRGSSLIFGSEIKTLLAHPYIEPVVDRDGIAEIFAIGPATPPGSGIFKQIKELPPAYCATVTRDTFKMREYWKPYVEEFKETEEEAVEHLRELFVDAVRRQLVGDVPLCCFLSGGLDSSAISAVAAAEFKKRGETLTTYSIDFEDNDKYFKVSLFQPTSDQSWALKMAEFIGSNHKTVILSQKQQVDALYGATIARDLPGMADIDSSLLLFCEQIRKGFVVALSGECADEVFGGYPWYTNPSMMYADTFPWSLYVGKRQEILSKNLGDLKLEEVARSYYRDTLSRVPHPEQEDPLDYRMRELFYLNIKWFMVNLLNRKDRMSMSNSLEVRVPFADKRLVQYSFNIPAKIKLAGGREKGLLRKALIGILPDEIIWRKKSPYPKTHHPEYTDLVCAEMDSILKDKNAPLLNLIDKDKVREIVDTRGEAYKAPWFGQLMTGPQMMAYLIQINIWLKEYKVKLEI
ncbi:asparagine synthase (glutamine-hydrolyzing) [[Clostridium] cellulosi]